MPKLKKTMFREYDIRGLVQEDELHAGSIAAIARAFAVLLKQQGVDSCIVGYDNRSYAKGLMQEAMRALVESGIHVKNIGQVTVPLAYWAQYYYDINGVCMGTASHNPNGWFGLKLGFDKSSTMNGFEQMVRILEEESYVTGKGSLEHVDADALLAAYARDVLGRAKLHRPLRVVVNTGNGVAGPIAVPVLKQFGCTVIEQNTQPDASFPNHEPNPSSVGFQTALESKVKETGADCGIGLDADGDRVGIVDEKGRTMYPDKMLIFLARLALVHQPGASIVYDVKCTRALADDIVRHGGIPVMWKTGHSHIKIKSKEVDAPVAGERSGHIFIRDGYYGFDDGLFAAMKFLEYVSSQEKTISELHDEVSTYVGSPTFQANCADEVKYAVVERLTSQMRERFGQDRVNQVNGARVEFEDGWGLVRASSNLPKLVFVFEATTRERMEEIKNIFSDILRVYPEVGDIEEE